MIAAIAELANILPQVLARNVDMGAADGTFQLALT
jgi:hypothetical protein